MTPLIKFNNAYLKREDQNPTGSAKDRAIELQVNHLKELGFHNAVISSTGNAAISALHFCKIAGISLDIFVSPNINSQKLKLLRGTNLHTSPKPVSNAFKFAKLNHSYLLRQSTDPIAQVGYSQIGEELILQLPKISSLFVPVGSGTTLLGISRKFPQHIKLFAIQPASYCPIASVFDTNFLPETITQTDSLSVKFLPLKNKILSVIKNTSGSGIVVQNNDLIENQKLLSDQGITTSAEGALALAGYHKSAKFLNIGDFPVILFTGTKR